MKPEKPALGRKGYKDTIQSLQDAGYNRVTGWEAFQTTVGPTHRYSRVSFNRYWTERISAPMIKGIVAQSVRTKKPATV